MMDVAMITGVSKGLGESLAKLLLEEGIYVHGISRSNNKDLSTNELFMHYPCDIGNINDLEKTIEQMKDSLKKQHPKKMLLINNAAVLHPINHSMAITNSELAYHIQVNTVAPMILMNSFLQLATKMDIQLIGVNITSGAAERGMYGWSAYCSTKASINMYTETIALEQKELKTQHKVIAFSPGIMDTNMQKSIRASSSEAFKDVATFKAFKENNDLKDTDTVGKILIDVIKNEENLKSGKVYNVHDYF